jgi:CspA family cold shock protein
MPRLSRRGVVKFFLPHKGYGFIIPDEGGPEVWFHADACHIARCDPIMPGDRVAYEQRQSEKGLRATIVVQTQDE